MSPLGRLYRLRALARLIMGDIPIFRSPEGVISQSFALRSKRGLNSGPPQIV